MKIEGKPFSAFDAAKLPGGLVPAVIQDDRTLQVLMLGYMNREAYEKASPKAASRFTAARASVSGPRARPAATGSTSCRWPPTATATRCSSASSPRPDLPHGVENLLRRGRARNRRFHPLPAKRHPGTSRRDARRLLHLEALQPRREQDRAEGRRGGCGDRHRGRGPEPRGDDLRRRRLADALRRQKPRPVERLQRRLAHDAPGTWWTFASRPPATAATCRDTIVTKKQYENFILDWDWKLSYGGNSGMLYHVVENPYFKVPYVTGPEYQLIDNEGWGGHERPDPARGWQKLGAWTAPCLPNPDSLLVNPQGEWNSSRIVCDNGHVEHWLNGRKILEFEAWTDDWFARKNSGKWGDGSRIRTGAPRRAVPQGHGYPRSSPQPENQGAAPQGRPRRSNSSTAATSQDGKPTEPRNGMSTRTACWSARAVPTKNTVTSPRANTTMIST